MGKKRREAWGRIGLSKEEMEERREGREAEEISREWIERLEEKEEEERKKRIEESRYNKHYKEIRTTVKPGYLKGRRKKKQRNTIARYRCGNETRDGRHWEEAEGRRCRICKEKEEDWTHILKECEATKEEIELRELMDENGGGYEKMKRINRQREESRMANKEVEGERGQG